MSWTDEVNGLAAAWRGQGESAEAMAEAMAAIEEWLK